jgi:hypothetical protein
MNNTALDKMVEHVRAMMDDLDESPEEAGESVWCNARDDGPHQ